jgi:hypothetical protein
VARELLQQLPQQEPGTPQIHAMMKVLGDYFEHHVREEEGEIFPEIERSGIDLDALGDALREYRGRDEQPRSRSRGQASDDERFAREHAGALSRSTLHAKWIHQPGDGPDHDGQTLATRSLDVIKAWADARGGRPATSPGGDPQQPRVLRLDFPDYDERLQEVSWDAWGRVFTERDLVFLFQETQKAGNQSNFFRLDAPDRGDG